MHDVATQPAPSKQIWLGRNKQFELYHSRHKTRPETIDWSHKDLDICLLYKQNQSNIDLGGCKARQLLN